jgi:NADH dehydrogenase
MTTLVVGATGFLGSRVCKELASQGMPVAGMVRSADDEAKVGALRAAGVELVEGDLKDPASLERACQGKTAVVSTASASISRQSGDNIQSVDLDGQRSLIDAAKAAGAAKFVYISFSSNMTTDAPVTAAKRTVEQHLMASGLDYTILRCGFLMEIMVNPIVGFDYPNAKAVVYGTGENRLSLLSMDDVAKMIALCLDHPQASNAVIEFGGPAPVTLHEAVRSFEEVSGRPFEMQHVPEEALVAAWEQSADPVSRSINALMVDFARGDTIDMEATLATFPVPMTSVRDYAAKVLANP